MGKKASMIPEAKMDTLDDFRLTSTDELNSREFVIAFPDGGKLSLKFANGAAEAASAGLPWPESMRGPLDVVKVRENAYFVDIDVEEPAIDGLNLVIMLDTGWALAVHQRRIAPEELWSRGPDVVQDFRAGAIEGYEQTGSCPAPTRDLLGARNFLFMGAQNLYEQIYISTKRAVINHAHTNVARGKAECQHATYYKLGDGLYLLGIREFDNGTSLLTLEDYHSKRMTGKAHHAVSRFESVSRFLGGTIIPVNGRLDYPERLEPDLN